jgi:hypothetical protein
MQRIADLIGWLIVSGLLFGTALRVRGGNEAINVDTATHRVMSPSTIDFSGVTVLGIGGGGGSPGGSSSQVQWNNSGAFGGVPYLTYDGVRVKQQAGARFNLADPTDTTKLALFDLSNVGTGVTRVVTVPNADTVLVQPNAATTNNFLTGITTQGVVTKAQPSATNLTNGVTGSGQVVLATSPTIQNPVINTNITLTGTLDYARVYSADSQIDIKNDNGLGVALTGTGFPGNGTGLDLRTDGSILLETGYGSAIPSAAGAVLDNVKVAPETTTVSGTTNITTAGGFNKFAIYRPTYTDSSAVTVTNAATLWIENSPLAAGSLSITNPYALWVDNGVTRLDGGLDVGTTGQAPSGVVDVSTGFRVAGAATSGNVLRGNGTNFVSAQLAYSDLSGTPSIPTAANPTATVGMSAVNGSATTYMRSDAAPALSAAISPTWTGTHTFKVAPSVAITNATTNAADTLLTLQHDSTGTVAAGFGSLIMYRLKDSGGSIVNAGGEQVDWLSATPGAATAELKILLANAGGAPAPVAVFGAGGGLSVGSPPAGAPNGVIDAGGGFTINGVTPGTGFFLQSDLTKYKASTWALPTSNGSSGQVLMSSGGTATVFAGGAVWDGVAAVSGSDATTTSTSFVDVTGLATAGLSSSTKYEVEIMLDVGTSADTNGTQYALHSNTGAGATMYVFTQGTTSSATAMTTVVGNAFDSGFGAPQTWLTAASLNGMIFVRGFVKSGSTPSTITVRHLKVTSGTSTVRVGSYIKWRKTP